MHIRLAENILNVFVSVSFSKIFRFDFTLTHENYVYIY